MLVFFAMLSTYYKFQKHKLDKRKLHKGTKKFLNIVYKIIISQILTKNAL